MSVSVHNEMASSFNPGFGARLRKERERRRITLSSVAGNTKISISLLQGLENDDVSRWPSGIFRRSFIRSYASAIGLDADGIAREFLERHPDPAEPLPATPAAAAESHGSGLPTFHVKLVDSARTFVRGPILMEARRRCAAAAWDVATVIALGAILFVGLRQFWMSVALATLAYYAGSIVLLGNTPGVSFFATAGPSSVSPAGGQPDAPPEKPQRSRLRVFTRDIGS